MSIGSYRSYLKQEALIADDDFEWALTCRRALHRIPELGFDLPRTRAFVAEALTKLDFNVDERAYGQSGLVASIEGPEPGPTIMLRADMDALPIEEVADREGRSTIPGNSHACGHDGHMAIALTVGRILARQRQSLAGRLVLCFQPSEEPGGGALAMIRDGVLERYNPAQCYGLHLWSELQTGQLAVTEKALFASCDKLSWTIKGSGGHGAIPHLAHDTVGALAQLIQANYHLVAREVDAQEAAVISIGQLAAGSIHNVIPEMISAGGTLRTESPSSRAFILERLKEIAEAIGRQFKVSISLEASGSIPACISAPSAVANVRSAAAGSLSGVCDANVDYSTLAGEDMAEFLLRVPGCYFLVGCGNADRGIIAPHHTSEFDLDEDALAIGASVLASSILNAIRE
ncbi:M20 family metallopeptidase [Bradyrhizobium sp. CCGUVB1N3]|uniref:M20 metallopeptidase family protein n=1 Tax=Bradyrhizobium sp. CCGUVB1N3 TaxID=2949629 RepID=UPI0020B2C2EC|nr:M20 family metallopeptidase [Bradyrhizobium sp. CCGUVB1N3]MCP3473519.1 M20 family metallopeptidase [Bradyrhizobium sp. CCGUVB1N3]